MIQIFSDTMHVEMNRANIYHVERTCCSWETWQTAVACGALHQASWAAKGSCTVATWFAPAESSCRISWKPPCLAGRERHSFPFWRCQAATLQPYTSGLIEGLCHQFCAHALRGGMCLSIHVGSLKLPDCILFCAPQPDASFHTVCYAKDKERTWGFLSLGVHCSTL